MAPPKNLKTYGRSNNSTINCFDALNILFAKNITARKLGGKIKKRKNKIQVKDLPIKIQSVFSDESSLHVNINDTFDRLLKQPTCNDKKKPKDISVQILSNNLSESVIKHKSRIHASSMLSKLRSYSSKTNTDLTNNTLSWFNHPTKSGERITNELEIEIVNKNGGKRNLKKYDSERESPILLRSKTKIPSIVEDIGNKSEPITKHKGEEKTVANETSILNSSLSFNPIFTNSVCERILVHCSTPMAPSKRKPLIKQPISPIKNLSDEVKSCIVESLEEINSWDTSLNIESKVSEKWDNSMNELEEFKGFDSRKKNLITVRTKITTQDKNGVQKVQDLKSYTASKELFMLEDFELFHSKYNQLDKTSYVSFALKDFEEFHANYMTSFCNNKNKFNFVTNRRKTKRLVSSKSASFTSKLVSLNEKLNLKNLVVVLDKILINDLTAKLRQNEQSLVTASCTHRTFSRLSAPASAKNSSMSVMKACRKFSLNSTQGKEMSRSEGNYFRDCSKVCCLRELFCKVTRLPLELEKSNYFCTDAEKNNYKENSKDKFGLNTSNDNHQTPKHRNSDEGRLRRALRSFDRLSSKTNQSKLQKSNDTSDYIQENNFLEQKPQECPVSPGIKDIVINLTLRELPLAKEDLQNDSLNKLDKTANSSEDSDVEIINSSLPTPQKVQFLVPFTPRSKWKNKILNLKAGKSWRRSLLLQKKESVADLTESWIDSEYRSSVSYLGNTRQSIKIVPVSKQEYSRRRTNLQSYAQTNLSVVLDQSVEEIIGVVSPTKTKVALPSLPIVTARDIVLQRCNQTEPVPFEELYPNNLLINCKKIGEGVYGEVYLCTRSRDVSTVMKIIPIEGDKIINGEKQKKFHEIISEVVIASELSNLRKKKRNRSAGFCEVQEIACVKGRYPKILIDLWHDYDMRKGSENDPPEVFDNDQLYVVLSLAHAGQDLESFVFTNATAAVSMFKQVACSLAIAEQELKFEHRDLHWGNVLIRASDRNKKIICRHKDIEIEIGSNGVEATVIDFTLSRIEHEGVVIFNDLGLDPDLFVAGGDYQFDIYRLMRENNRNNWETFEPYTNILWLHYILKKSIKELRYKNTKTKIHKKGIEELRNMEKDLLEFQSATDFVSSFS